MSFRNQEELEGSKYATSASSKERLQMLCWLKGVKSAVQEAGTV